MEEDKQRLSQVLSAIFYAFEEHPGQGVCVAEIVGGLSLLCGGNKSSKLAVRGTSYIDSLRPTEKLHASPPTALRAMGG